MQTITQVEVTNFLSFVKAQVKLSSLNVLVGQNGSGKTNFLRIFQFIGEVARRDLAPAIDLFNGFDNLRFRGESSDLKTITIKLKGLMTEHSHEGAPDEYSINFSERIRRRGSPDTVRRYINRKEDFVFKRTRGRGRRITLSGVTLSINIIDRGSAADGPRSNEDRKLSVQSNSSGLSTIRKLGDEYGATQVETLADIFENLRLYDVDVEKARRPAPFIPPVRLMPNGRNIGPYLYYLKTEEEEVLERISDDVRFVLPSFREFRFTQLGGSSDAVRVDLLENHLRGSTPLGIASFGTVRAIALFAMLHDPNPPRLTCLEEVDHGLHPHALDRLVDRLREASEKTQIIAATHSPALVNRLNAEELIILERDSETGASIISDITPEEMRDMSITSGFSLGELWFAGSLGG